MNKILFLLSLVVVTAPHAQSLEPAWRVLNMASATIVPDYEPGENPFPMQEAPEETEEAIDWEKLALTKEKANLLGLVRQSIAQKDTYTPQMSNFQLRSILKGREGLAALIGTQWFKKGETLSVPISNAKRTLDILDRLKEIDPRLEKDLRRDIRKTLPKNDKIVMRVISIQEKSVILKDENTKQYTLTLK